MKHNYLESEPSNFDYSDFFQYTSPEYWLNHGNWAKKSQMLQYTSLQDSRETTEEKQESKKFSGYRQKDLDAFNKMYDQLGESDFREFLTKIAGLESKWQNDPKGNKTHSGLYQIKNTYLEHYTGVPGITKEQFVNNPKLQTKAALALAKENYTQIMRDETLLKAAKQRGYDEWDLMAGAWLAGYKGMRRQFFTGKEVGDANGTTITKRMNAYKNMQI